MVIWPVVWAVWVVWVVWDTNPLLKQQIKKPLGYYREVFFNVSIIKLINNTCHLKKYLIASKIRQVMFAPRCKSLFEIRPSSAGR